MRTISSKVDNGIHEKVVDRCNGLGCSPSQYIKDLIDRDLKGDIVAEPTTNVTSDNLKSEKPIAKAKVARFMSSGEEGKYPKARVVHVFGADKQPIRTDHYDENGKLKYSEEPPAGPGRPSRVILHV
jgi:hypothetical protein